MSASLRNALEAVAPNAQVTSSSTSSSSSSSSPSTVAMRTAPDADTQLCSGMARSGTTTSGGRTASTPSQHQVPQNDVENEGPSRQEGFSTIPNPQQPCGPAIVPASATSQTPRTEPRRSSPMQRSVTFGGYVQQRPYISHGGGFEVTYLRLSREMEELVDTLSRIPEVGLNEVQAFHHFTLYPFRLSFRPGERIPLRYGRDLRTVIAKHFSVREQDLHLEVIHTHHRQPLLDTELLHDLKGSRPQLQVTFLIQPAYVADLSDSPCPRCVEISRRLGLEAQLDRCPDPVQEEEFRRHCAAHPIDWYPQARPYEGRSDPRGAMGFNEHCIVPTKPDEDGRARFRRDPYNCANFVRRTQAGVWTATPWPTPNLAMLPLPVVTTAAKAKDDNDDDEAPAAALQSTAASDVDDDGDSGEGVGLPLPPRSGDAPLGGAGPTAAAAAAAAVPESLSQARLSTSSSSSAAAVATHSTAEEETVLPPTVQQAPADLTAVADADAAEKDDTAPLNADEAERDCGSSDTTSAVPEHPDASAAAASATTTTTTATATSPSRQPPPQPPLLGPAAALRAVEGALDAASGRPAEERPSAERVPLSSSLSSSSSSRARPSAKAKGGKASKQTARPHEPQANPSAPHRRSLPAVGKAKPAAPVDSESKPTPARKKTKKRTVDPDEAVLRAAEQQRAAAERASKARCNVPRREPPRRVEHDSSDGSPCDNQKIAKDKDARRLRAEAARSGETTSGEEEEEEEEEEVGYGEVADGEIKHARELLDRIDRHAKLAHLVTRDQALHLCREATACERCFIRRTGTPTTAVPPFHVLNFRSKVTALALAVRGFASALSVRPAVHLPAGLAKIAIELRAVYLGAADDHHHPSVTFGHALTLYPLGLTTMLFQMRVAATNRLDFPAQFWDEASDRVDACPLRAIVPQAVPQRLPNFLTPEAICPVTEMMAAMLWDALVLNVDLESCQFRLAAWHEPITELANFLHLDSVLVIMAPILAALCEGLVDLDADETKGALHSACRSRAASRPCNQSALTAIRLRERCIRVRRVLQKTVDMVRLWNALYLAWHDAQHQVPAALASA